MSHTPRLLHALSLALLLVVGAALAPPAATPLVPFLATFDAPVARAANGLDITSAARYVVVPGKALIRTTVDLRVTNTRPDRTSGGVITRYFYDGVNVGVQPEATHLHATQDGVAVPVSAAARKGYKLAQIGFRHDIFRGQTATVRLTYDLPAGKPRSASDVRVGKAFASFLAWAFGDSGSVRIEVPAGFNVDVSGEDVTTTTGSGGTQVLSATTSDPLTWYAWVNARNDDGLTRERLSIKGGEVVIVRGWPEDRRWRTSVGTLLTSGVPQLVSRIGLPWPVDGALNVLEIHTPLLEGYAGFYDTAHDEITVSEDLDDLTIIHEASHAWFNKALFAERWITEGLADEYASSVIDAVSGHAPGPGKVSRDSRYAFALNTWPPPAAIEDTASDARERYGYDASWTVIRQVVRSVGVAGMRSVFKAASDHTTAYVGAGAPETAVLPNDWRRFLDLTEELGGGAGISGLMAKWALPTGSEAQLVARERARTAYRALLEAGRGWKAPYAVRKPMDAWSFEGAEARIGEATAVLAERDRTDTLAATLSLSPGSALEQQYEASTDQASLAAADTAAQAAEASLEQVAAATTAASTGRDWITSIGLAGFDPDASLAQARADWERGAVDVAAGEATDVTTRLAAAPEAGRAMVVRTGVLVGVAALLLLLLLAMAIRRRRRRPALAPAWPASPGAGTPPGPPPWDPGAGTPPGPPPWDRGAGTPPGPPAGGPGAPGGYATLPPNAPPVAEPDPERAQEEGAEPS